MLFVFFCGLLYFLYTVLTIAYAEFLNDLKFVLSAIAKIYFITKSNFMPIFWARISFKHNYSPIYIIFCSFSIHLPFPISNIFIIVYCSYCFLHCISQTLQAYFKPQLFLNMWACLNTFYFQNPFHLSYLFWANQWLKATMIFNFKIILYLVKRIAITKESLSLTTTNVECAKNILFKILNSHAIIKLNSIANFCSNGCKVVTIIFKIIIWSSKCVIDSCAIYYVVQSKCLVDYKKICWYMTNLYAIVSVSPTCAITFAIWLSFLLDMRHFWL